MTLEEATSKVKSLAANNSGKLGATVNFKFDEGIIHLNDTISPTAVVNEDHAAQCDILISLDNFEKMMGGDLNPMMAFMMGKMKIEGDKGIAMKLAAIL